MGTWILKSDDSEKKFPHGQKNVIEKSGFIYKWKTPCKVPIKVSLRFQLYIIEDWDRDRIDIQDLYRMEINTRREKNNELLITWNLMIKLTDQHIYNVLWS